MNTKRNIKILFVLSIILILGAPFFPNIMYSIIETLHYNFIDYRRVEIISCMRTCGVMLSIWGIVLYLKMDK